MGGISYVSISRQFKRAEEEIKMKKGCYEEMVKISKELSYKYKT